MGRERLAEGAPTADVLAHACDEGVRSSESDITGQAREIPKVFENILARSTATSGGIELCSHRRRASREFCAT